MTEPIRVAVRLPHSWCVASLDAIVEVAELADELDMDVSVQDHLLADGSVSPCGHAHDGEDRTVFEAHTTLAYVAARTRRSRLIAGVYVLPYRHPVWLAKETASLDALSQGRLVVGVGVGALRGRGHDHGQNLGAHQGIAVREFDTFGVLGHRGRMMDEYLRILDALWTQDPASYQGEFVSFEGLDLYPRPASRPRPPIWVGGRSEAAQDRAARLADGWFPSQPPVEVVAEGRQRLERVAAEAGRPTPTLAINIFAAIDADGERARDAMRDALAHRFAGDAPLFEATLAGTPDEVRARMQRYVEAGVRTFDLKYLPLTVASTVAQMRRMAEEVLPGLAAVSVGSGA
jgi:probable F420-dependent oxidoreductase